MSVDESALNVHNAFIDTNFQTASKIHEQLYSLKEYQNARTVSIYLSMPNGEVSTKDIVKHALQSGKTVFVPYLYHDQSLEPPRSTMDMVSLHSQADYEAFKPDKWGIPVPDTTSISGRLRCLRTGSEDTTSNKGARSKLDLIVVPGVAFDKDCRRLGHGRGYYDFFLSRYQSNNNSLGSQATMPFLGKNLAAGLLRTH